MLNQRYKETSMNNKKFINVRKAKELYLVTCSRTRCVKVVRATSEREANKKALNHFLAKGAIA
tara:strand:+ start:4457 stop:4645 length:189 start_codon:yes stop_codon:yes gene_type:complete